MTTLQAILIDPQPLAALRPFASEIHLLETERSLAQVQERMVGRVWWHISSTATAGETASTLHSLLVYTRAAGIDSRWLVLDGPPDVFRFAKHLHLALNGRPDAIPLNLSGQEAYREATVVLGDQLADLVCPGDIAFLHGPATAGLAPVLTRLGVYVVWQSHSGVAQPTAAVEQAWAVLGPELAEVGAIVLSRPSFVPAGPLRDRSLVIEPAVDPLATKNWELGPDCIRAILVHTGLIEGPLGSGSTVIRCGGRLRGRVDRGADVIRLGRAPTWETPLVVHIARWDTLKDAVGLRRGFAECACGCPPAGAELILAGPNVHAVADDPDAAAVFAEVLTAWRQLCHTDRRRIHLVSLPTADPVEHAAIVNALQRHAAVVVQKSLDHEFGLTAAEAMWKARPVIVSSRAAIADRITTGRQGLVLHDPTDSAELSAALRQILVDRPAAERLGPTAQAWMRSELLFPHSLGEYASVLDRIDTARLGTACARRTA